MPQPKRGGDEHAMGSRRLLSISILRKASDAAPDVANAADDELHSDDEPTHDRATLRPVEFAYNSVVAAAAAASQNNTTASLTGRHGFEGHRNSSGSGTLLLSSTSLEWGVARVGEIESRRDRQQQQQQHQQQRDVEDPSDAPASANSNTSRNLDDNTPGSGYTSNARRSDEGASTSVRNPTSDTSPPTLEAAPSATESATSCSPGQGAAAVVSVHVAEPAAVSQHPPAAEIATMVATSIAEPIGVDTASPDLVAAADDGSRAGPHVGSRNVYVAALPLDFTESDLTVLLREFGKVKSCRMFNAGSRVDEIGRSYGFALFEDPSSAERAVAALDGKPMGNARMQCQLSRNGVVKKSKKEARVLFDTSGATPRRHDDRARQSSSAPMPPQQPQPQPQSSLPFAHNNMSAAAPWGNLQQHQSPAAVYNPMMPFMPSLNLFAAAFGGWAPSPPLGMFPHQHQQQPMAAPTYNNNHNPAHGWGAGAPSAAAAADMPVPVMTPHGVIWMRRVRRSSAASYPRLSPAPHNNNNHIHTDPLRVLEARRPDTQLREAASCVSWPHAQVAYPCIPIPARVSATQRHARARTR